MVGSTIHFRPQTALECPECGLTCLPGTTICPRCSTSLALDEATAIDLDRRPQAVNQQPETGMLFGPRATLLLRFEDDTLLSLDMRQPLLLGREAESLEYDALDLTGFNAYPLGVSRQHCVLRRHNMQLVVRDLASANGTFLAEQRLTSHIEYAVQHGDTLRLGRLELRVQFNTSE